jgi:hypothetical protein
VDSPSLTICLMSSAVEWWDTLPHGFLFLLFTIYVFF